MSRHKSVLKFIIVTTLILFLAYFTLTPASVRYSEGLGGTIVPIFSGGKLKIDNTIDASLKLWNRTDVKTFTEWGAPIIWERIFDRDECDREHKKKHSSVALTVFAVGRYLDAYLENFLLSAELHFMVALPVTYYVFTDAPAKVPKLQLAEGRRLNIIEVQKHSRWQDISMMRMRAIADAINDILHTSSYVFCFDADQLFVGRFGSEALGESVALLHAHFYRYPRDLFTYDRNPNSTAYMKAGAGDFYYHAAVFGGTWQNVLALTESCYRTILEDKSRGVEALWHDESHLNKYLWLHKPSRVLSPEYCWDQSLGHPSDIRVKRLLWAEKQYDRLRDAP
ncbi:alpha-1,3-galactosyltransferase 2-like [Hypomesus transpacificus]|uniref:alpha-1,3-galactosyltransferase 2-like n=1 Tax=Hypomesus transpacificus TaxID=137520 RepID=UPI001F0748DF|nr:alpha-1,3-galactosyltransferase 2-like [Hypomesus transpacificus]